MIPLGDAALGLLARGLRDLGARCLAVSETIAIPPAPVTLLSEASRRLLAENRRFRDKHSARRCFVVGNGPSLAAMDLSRLAGEITFVTNSFHLSGALSQWQPTYYCIIDPQYFADSPQTREHLQEIQRRATSASFFVPLFFHKPLPTVEQVRGAGVLDPNRTFFLALGGDPALQPVTTVDPRGFLPPLLNVAQVAIALAIYMACSPIVLIGLDHDWLARPGEESHFYAETPEVEELMLKRYREQPSLYRRTLEVHLKTWRGYALLSSYAQRRGLRILNATAGGYLDVFERAEFEEILAGSAL